MAVERIDYEKCSHCLKCWRICPMDVYRVAGRQVYITYPQDCMCCFLCELECPEEAIYVNPQRGQPKPFPW
ncbi:MAG: 4Fe-4S binding protein [Firmicutes bacterium]|nr:4Fe-4S binding protein [Bacillota bacterium]